MAIKCTKCSKEVSEVSYDVGSTAEETGLCWECFEGEVEKDSQKIITELTDKIAELEKEVETWKNITRDRLRTHSCITGGNVRGECTGISCGSDQCLRLHKKGGRF